MSQLSSGLQVPSPQVGHAPQSSGQSSQASPSSHAPLPQTAPPQAGSSVPEQVPSAHVSLTVHGSLSLQSAVLLICEQPIAGSQAESVHGLPSSQSTGVPLQAPPMQASAAVQRLLSSQAEPSATGSNAQAPVAGSHASVVHASPSSQAIGVPAQPPSPQVSSAVQASPSSQPPPLGAYVQPVAGSQLSLVQSSPSSHAIAMPLQAPSTQASPSVQASPSSHCAVVGVYTQPWAASHESDVQGLPSSQSSAVPPQVPPVHTSFVVHPSPSLQAEPFATLDSSHSPVAPLQELTLQGLPAAPQVTTVAASVMHWFPAQTSVPLHRLASSNSAQSSLASHWQLFVVPG